VYAYGQLCRCQATKIPALWTAANSSLITTDLRRAFSPLYLAAFRSGWRGEACTLMSSVEKWGLRSNISKILTFLAVWCNCRQHQSLQSHESFMYMLTWSVITGRMQPTTTSSSQSSVLRQYINSLAVCHLMCSLFDDAVSTAQVI